METGNFGQAMDVNSAGKKLLKELRRVKFFYGENWAKAKKVILQNGDEWNEVTKDQFYDQKMWLGAKVVKLFDGDSWAVVKNENVNVFYEEEE